MYQQKSKTKEFISLLMKKLKKSFNYVFDFFQEQDEPIQLISDSYDCLLETHSNYTKNPNLLLDKLKICSNEIFILDSICSSLGQTKYNYKEIIVKMSQIIILCNIIIDFDLVRPPCMRTPTLEDDHIAFIQQASIEKLFFKIPDLLHLKLKKYFEPLFLYPDFQKKDLYLKNPNSIEALATMLRTILLEESLYFECAKLSICSIKKQETKQRELQEHLESKLEANNITINPNIQYTICSELSTLFYNFGIQNLTSCTSIKEGESSIKHLETIFLKTIQKALTPQS